MANEPETTEEPAAATGEEAEGPRDEGYIEDVTVSAIRVETDLMKTPPTIWNVDKHTDPDFVIFGMPRNYGFGISKRF